MADNVGYTPGTGATVAADEIAGILHQRVKIGVGGDGVAVDVSSSNPMPVSGTVTANTGLSQPLTDAQLRASSVPISGTVTANTGLLQAVTDAQLRATPVPVSGAFFQATQPVSIASSVPVTGPVTDAQLRATPVPVSGTVTANTGLTQPLTDAQLRATAVPVSIGSIGLPTGASTLAEQQSQTTILGTIDADTASISTSCSSIDGKTPNLVSGRVPVDGSGVVQPVADAQSGNLLQQILQMLIAPLGYDKSLGRQRGTVVVESGTVTTVTNLTSLNGIGGYSAQMQVFDTNRTSWAQCVRSRIT